MSSDETVTKPAKQRSPVERAIVWGGILLLLLVVGIEYRAQQGYANSLQALSDASDETEGELTLDEVEALFSGGPSRSVKTENGIETHFVYSWLSFFKSGEYVLNVLASKDEPSHLLRYYTADGVDPMAPIPPKNPTPKGNLSLSGGPGRGSSGGGESADTDEKTAEGNTENNENDATDSASTESSEKPADETEKADEITTEKPGE